MLLSNMLLPEKISEARSKNSIQFFCIEYMAKYHKYVKQLFDYFNI